MMPKNIADWIDGYREAARQFYLLLADNLFPFRNPFMPESQCYAGFEDGTHDMITEVT